MKDWSVGRTESMQVWAQVFQTDVSRLRIGQSAIVKAETGGFEGEVPATLKSIIGKVSQRLVCRGRTTM